ncbi:hypothetical protein GCM10022295_91200 [Streptomyces osmaniensis]|uniref:Uncharacterized protein n=1 Tax=Streptomyces osmaniensis TaxID=593134 RepID=A0ABP6Z294_9ACTN
MVLSRSVKELTHSKDSSHLAKMYSPDVSKQTISPITDAAMPSMTASVMEGMAE